MAANADLCLGGYKLAGQGFLFADRLRGATPLDAMRRLLAEDPRSGQLVQPYMGGDELNTSPTLTPERWAINFGRMSLDDAQRWPQLLRIVEAKVKPERDRANRDAHRLRWWQFGETRPGLTEAAADLERILACASISTYLAWAWLSPRVLPSHNLSVVVLDTDAAFAILQSRVHEFFASFFSSTLEDRQGYRPSDCFGTFPFPEGWQTNTLLESAGCAYYEFRATLMVRNNDGLTKTYGRFHDPEQRDDPDIRRFHELHDAMDRAVLDAYGWTDLQPKCEFFLDYEEEDEAEGDGGKTKPEKEPWRYRWPDGIREDVLARLLALNQQRSVVLAKEGRDVSATSGTRRARTPVGQNEPPSS